MTKLLGYLDSMQLTANSKTSQFFEYVLGERGKGMSLVDGIFATMSSAGLLLVTSYPKYAIPLYFFGTAPLVYRRGPEAAFLVPLAVATSVKHPELAVAVVKETTETFGEAAKGAIRLGFQVSGLIVTAAGVVVGLVFSKGKKKGD